MEPRARAGKNVGKQNFNTADLSPLLVSHGDVSAPLPETIRVLDEILTEFVQGVSFEAVQAANYAGRQKVKYEDFEFAIRKNPRYLGKVQEVFEKKTEMELIRKSFNKEEELLKQEAKTEKRLAKAAERAEKKAARQAAKAGSAVGSSRLAGSTLGGDGTQEDHEVMDEEELGEADDDADADADADVDMGLE